MACLRFLVVKWARFWVLEDSNLAIEMRQILLGFPS
jgi:hypothetical protein